METITPLAARPVSRHLPTLQSLVAHLAELKDQACSDWQDWQVRPIAGGWNNLLFRATGPLGDLAIKFTIRDARDRAGREYQALRALQQAGLNVAATPILLDRTRYAQPVVVSTWLEGIVSADLPITDDEWRDLLRHLALVHSVTPAHTPVRIRRAVLTADSAAAGRRIVQECADRLPAEILPAETQALLQRLAAVRLPTWPRPPVTLCRVDPNLLNFVRRPGMWASVDWENSGWGDPAFDLADLVLHPSFLGTPEARWEWVIQTYARLISDPTVQVRIQTYRLILAIWWVLRLQRYLHEIPQGLDRRLIPQPDNRLADLTARCAHYLALAQTLYDTV
jgi:aminoglycoside phosphotransferase (APT) family kinase protein